MSYTFGGATSDYVNITAVGTMVGDNSVSFVAGWWYPTTLTAGRGYWSAGNVAGAVVDSTTSEIRMITDNNATDGEWVTSGAGIVTDKWQFLAFLAATENTTVAGDWRVWVGDINTPPVIQTPSVSVSRSGNYNNSTNRTIGNLGTGSLAFQGDIGWVVMGKFVFNTALRIPTSGVISATDAQLFADRWVIPLWAGRPVASEFQFIMETITAGLIHFPLDQVMASGMQWSHGTGPNNPLTLGYNGVTASENQPPIRMPRDWLFRPVRTTISM